MIMSIGHGLLIAFAPMQWLWLLLLPVTLFLRMALNAIDGMLAREHDQKSRLGAMLNELSDVISDAALYLPFALVAPLSPIAAVIAVVLAGLTEMTGVVAQTIGSTRRYDGPMGKSDRAFAYGLLAFLLAIGLGGASMDAALSMGDRAAAARSQSGTGRERRCNHDRAVCRMGRPCDAGGDGGARRLCAAHRRIDPVAHLLQRKSGGAQGELVARVKSWWVMVTVFTVAVFIYQPLVGGVPRRSSPIWP